MLMSDVNKFYISPMANNQWMNYKQQAMPMGKNTGRNVDPSSKPYKHNSLDYLEKSGGE